VEELLRALDDAGRDGFLTSPTSGDQAPPCLDLSETIGPYRLLERLGEGGFGEVWTAEQTKPMRRTVALKILKPGMDSKEVLARFEVERQALALMDHPNVAQVYDAGATDQGRPYFVMEHAAGLPLTDYCDAGRLRVRQRLELFVQICEAVQHAHTKGIIHRDLKPSNILVTLADGKPVPKVIDFGIAKATAAPLTDRTLHTEIGRLMGTPEYMSPEQAGTSDLDVDTRSDVYSLGVILYQLLTGTLPFEPQTLRKADHSSLVKIIREMDPPTPSGRLSTLGAEPVNRRNGATPQEIADRRDIEFAALQRQVKGELDWIVMKCLEKDRARRYETANGLASDVRHFLSGEPVVAAPPSRLYRVRKFVRRNRVMVTAATIVVAVLLAGTAGTTFGLLRAEQRRAQSDAALQLAEKREKETQQVSDFLAAMLS
jgi:non-specific serine/threonine protein kinase/serine/threonine-protein kinase